jgi:hypothetical protein
MIVEGREQYRDEQGDDADNDQELDERKAAFSVCRMFPPK